MVVELESSCNLKRGVGAEFSAHEDGRDEAAGIPFGKLAAPTYWSIWSRTMLRWQRFQGTSDFRCVMCHTACEEDIMYLFFSCPFAQRCWNSLGASTGLRVQMLFQKSLQLIETWAGPNLLRFSLLRSGRFGISEREISSANQSLRANRANFNLGHRINI